ncbi:MAG: PAS domain S-box protein [Chloroflexaceae bacterium]|nr:PAS domain S-box protein [Chloroflexaceae bacterium]
MTIDRETLTILQQENEQLRQRIQELEQNEQHAAWFRRIVERCPMPITISTEAEGRIRYANPALRHAFALPPSPDEPIPVQFPELYVSIEDRHRLIGIMRRDGYVHGAEVEFRRTDGTTFWALISYIPVQYEGEAAIMAYIYDISSRKQVEDDLRIFQDLMNNLPDGVLVLRDNRITFVNPAYGRMIGFEEPELIGQSLAIITESITPDNPTQLQESFIELTEHGFWKGRGGITNRRGTYFTGEVTMLTLPDPQYPTDTLLTIQRDVSDVVQQEQERAAMQERIIQVQRAALLELSTPLIPIADNVLVMPLIGSIDTNRSQQIMDALLEGIAQHRAEFAILDITGVKVVDTQVAHGLIRTAQAVQLLGARMIMTGIGAPMAQTLVHLGIDLGSIVTRSTLQAGIEYALRRR